MCIRDSLIRDYFAKRTFDESGHYTVDNFGIEIKESLNDRESNEGVYFEGQQTSQGNTPSEDLMAVKVSSGTAYVKGYDVDKLGTTVIDVDKPRDVEKINASQVPFEFGTRIKLNNVHGTPEIKVGSTLTVDLYDERRGSNTNSNGTKVGTARVYTHNLADAPYSNAATEHDLYLYDVQTFTDLVINVALSPLQCPATSFIKGVSSGATGFVETSANNTTAVKLTQTSGTFIVGEQIIINGDESLIRSIQSVDVHGIRDVKSVHQATSGLSGYISNFGGDVVLQKTQLKGLGIADQVQIATNGVVTSPKSKIISSLKVGDIIKYPVAGQAVESFNRVESVGVTTAKVEAVTDVTGVCEGGLPSAAVLTNITVGSPIVNENGGLFAKIDDDNISTLNLASSNLLITKQVTGEATNSVTGELTVDITSLTGISSALFETFDAERYYVTHGTNGDIEDITSDQVTLVDGGNSVKFTGLTANKSVVVNVTAKKLGIQSKKKEYIRSEKLTVSGTVSAASTAVSGLTTSTYFGTRVQDSSISLNLPDVVEIVGVYESLNTSAPTLDSITFPTGLNLDTSSILGERIIGSTSGAVAQIVTRSSATKVEISYLNSSKFVVGEVATFEESSITSVVQVVSNGNFQDITKEYNLDKGQRDQFYDYSRIVKKGSYTPSRQLLIIFNWFDVPSSDGGDVFTVNSYPDSAFKHDIPTISGVRASDTIDFRPRVPRFTATDKSPFAFSSRDFSASTNPQLIVTPKESSLVGYEYYLPRIDRVVLGVNGELSVIKGTSSDDPKIPVNVEDAMDIATIELPAYLYHPDDAVIKVIDNRRYTMLSLIHI